MCRSSTDSCATQSRSASDTPMGSCSVATSCAHSTTRDLTASVAFAATGSTQSRWVELDGPALRARATNLTPDLGWTSEPAAPAPPRSSRSRWSGRPSGHGGRPDVSPYRPPERGRRILIIAIAVSNDGERPWVSLEIVEWSMPARMAKARWLMPRCAMASRSQPPKSPSAMRLGRTRSFTSRSPHVVSGAGSASRGR